ncbi:ACT domain-containing protein [Dechloromonas sp. ZY10]|uniref:ACT domain-containing protein n=1 Tax=Dechloromonas aquae TaxID=2664436 RepID=UPI003526F80D
MSSTAISALPQLLASLQPELCPGVYVYATLPLTADPQPYTPLATIRETEALTVIVPEAVAEQAGLPIHFRCAWITLRVHSDLAAVGLTAAFANTLGAAGISCNVLAGTYHDHLLVPVASAEAALSALQRLQSEAAAETKTGETRASAF